MANIALCNPLHIVAKDAHFSRLWKLIYFAPIVCLWVMLNLQPVLSYRKYEFFDSTCIHLNTVHILVCSQYRGRKTRRYKRFELRFL